jgi:hypothetical protein
MPDPNPPERQLDEALKRRRPGPSRDFGDQLRERLLATQLRARRPARLWPVVAAYLCSGLVLLALAAFGAAGVGPFG